MIFEHACKRGLEGIVCKQLDLPYRAGLSKCWIKVKNKKYPAMLWVKDMSELERVRALRWRQCVGSIRELLPR